METLRSPIRRFDLELHGTKSQRASIISTRTSWEMRIREHCACTEEPTPSFRQNCDPISKNMHILERTKMQDIGLVKATRCSEQISCRGALLSNVLHAIL
jgi:hypothetical protein